MTDGNANAAALLKELREAQAPITREMIFARIGKEFGEGFAKVVRAQFNDAERRHAQRTPRAPRKGRKR